MTGKNDFDGTDNVLTELGFDDAEELSAKAVLAVKLNELIEKRGLSQTEAAVITGMTQPKVSQVRRYKLRNTSLERLMRVGRRVSRTQSPERLMIGCHRCRYRVG